MLPSGIGPVSCSGTSRTISTIAAFFRSSPTKSSYALSKRDIITRSRIFSLTASNGVVLPVVLAVTRITR